jgi:hypothetical protein
MGDSAGAIETLSSLREWIPRAFDKSSPAYYRLVPPRAQSSSRWKFIVSLRTERRESVWRPEGLPEIRVLLGGEMPLILE